MAIKIQGRFPTVPEYYMEHINSSIDLLQVPKQCCPFHSENTPSFSYNVETGRWSCFGKCHAHGDVIEMHRRWFHLSTREEAESSLASLYNVTIKRDLSRLSVDVPIVNESRIEDNSVYAEALALANTPERWLELDYEMSKYPFERNNLISLIYKWKGVKSVLDM